MGSAGIIPARAGFTSSARSRRPSSPDHPRSRGVYRSVFSVASREPGSSPLARGLHGEAAPARTVIRIIPARAGFTLNDFGCECFEWDHPRSRGVYVEMMLPREHEQGSSPLARGLRVEELVALRRIRIIPARAGFTTGTVIAEGDGRDHPRSRGVYSVAHQKGRIAEGSSPLARGLLALVRESRGFGVDHPRSRGVYPCATHGKSRR